MSVTDKQKLEFRKELRQLLNKHNIIIVQEYEYQSAEGNGYEGYNFAFCLDNNLDEPLVYITQLVDFEK